MARKKKETKMARVSIVTENATAKKSNVTKKQAISPDGNGIQKEVKQVVILPADSNNTSCSLAELTPLNKTGIPNGILAMREVNKQHVSHLKMEIEAGGTLPPLDVVAVQDTDGETKLVPVDGYHRWAAYEENLMDALNDAYDDISTEEMQNARKQYRVAIKEVDASNSRDVLRLAFEANLKHGLPASDASRSRFAIWLISEAEQNGEKMSMREAGRLAGVSHVAISKAMVKLGLSKKKMVDVQLTEEDADEIEAEIEAVKHDKEANESPIAKADKHAMSFVNAIKFFDKTEWTRHEMIQFVSQYGQFLTKAQIEVGIAMLAGLQPTAKQDEEPVQQKLAIDLNAPVEKADGAYTA